MLNRRPLGRGLDALIENTAIETTPADAPASGAHVPGRVDVAPTSAISPNPFQPRATFDLERLQELARAISSQGVIEPLIVRPARNTTPGAPRYELIAGERRLRAARIAGLVAVPVVIRDLDDRAALEMSLVENLAREDLNAVDEARALARLNAEFRLGHEEIAVRIGKSRPYVSNAIRLLDLPEAVLEMIARGELTAGQTRPLLAIGSREAQVIAAKKIAAGKISARAAEALVGEARRRRAGNGLSHTSDDPNLSALAESIQRAFRRKVRIVRRRGKTPGRIELEYYDDNDLNALAAILLGHPQAPVTSV